MVISGKAKLAGVMGWPVGHSLSPRLHNYWLGEYDIDGAYVPLPVKPDDLKDALRALPRLGFKGVNLTVPHKEAAAGIVDRLDKAAERVGAVNTVVVTPAGELIGDNTDGYGFIENLKADAPAGWKADRGPAVVLGAGGAARAIAVALADAGAREIRIVNRSRDRGRALVRDLGRGTVYVPWTERASVLKDATLLVNATSLGMAGGAALDIGLDALPVKAVVNDIVYSPLKTPLLKAAAKRGNPTVDGIGMLLHQARPGFRDWFGVRPKVTPALKAYVLKGLDK